MSFLPNDTVLVTGANGHVGQHVISQLLSLSPSSRPHVRAAVRSASSATGLQTVFSEFLTSGHLEFVFIPDIVAPGAYDNAVRGCTHIAHIASPLVLAPESIEDDLLRPAIQGTVGLLRAAHANATETLRAVVVTSSFAAAFDPFQGFRPGHRYAGADWSPLTYAQGTGHEPIAQDALSAELRGFIPYLSSKKLAEAAAWEYYHEILPAWRFCTILPTYIGGPCVVPLKGEDGTDGYSFSQKILTGIALDGKVPKDDFPTWVDVRDVARAHLAALLRSEASEGTGRWILSAKSVTMGELAGIVHKNFPGLAGGVPGKEGSAALKEGEYFEIDREQSQRALSMDSWIGVEEMVKETIKPVLEYQNRRKA